MRKKFSEKIPTLYIAEINEIFLALGELIVESAKTISYICYIKIYIGYYKLLRMYKYTK